MFEQLDQSGKKPKVSTAMSLGILVAYLLGTIGGLCLFVVLRERPFGIQIATAITYTYFAFWYIFFPTRGMIEKYSLQNEMVQWQVPSLLAIHSAFLISMFFGQTVWFAMRPRLPGYWSREYGTGMSLYVWVIMASFLFAFFTQVLICRRILSHSLEGKSETSDSE